MGFIRGDGVCGLFPLGIGTRLSVRDCRGISGRGLKPLAGNNKRNETGSEKVQNECNPNLRTTLLMVLLLAVTATVAEASPSVSIGTNDKEDANVPSPTPKMVFKRGRVNANRKAVQGARVPKSYAGKAAANLRQRPAAMGLIGMDVDIGSTAEEVIQELGLDEWKAVKTAQYIETGDTWKLADGSEVPAVKKLNMRWNTTVHSQTLQPFGNVGKDYEILQHDDAIRTLHDVADTLNLEYEYAHLSDNGATLTAALIVPDEVIEFNNGEERLQQYLAVNNTHDGKAAFTVSQFVMRLWCWNQFVATVNAAAQGNERRNVDYTMRASIRHSARMHEAIAEFSDIMARQAQHNRAFAAVAEDLLQHTMSDDQMLDYWVSVLDLECDPSRITEDGTNPWGLSQKGLNILETCQELRIQDQNQIGDMDGTSWQALQVALDYYDHEKNYDVKGNVKSTSVLQCLHGTGVQAKIAMQEKAIRLLYAQPEQYGEILTFKVKGSKHRATTRGGSELLVAAPTTGGRRIGENEQVFEG